MLALNEQHHVSHNIIFRYLFLLIICSYFTLIFQVEHRLKPFHGARVCFVGFPEEEEQHMTEILVSNGGTVTNVDDPACTHVVSSSIFFLHCFLIFKFSFVVAW